MPYIWQIASVKKLTTFVIAVKNLFRRYSYVNETTKKMYEYVNLIGKLMIYETDIQIVIATPAMSSQNFCAINASDSNISL